MTPDERQLIVDIRQTLRGAWIKHVQAGNSTEHYPFPLLKDVVAWIDERVKLFDDEPEAVSPLVSTPGLTLSAFLASLPEGMAVTFTAAGPWVDEDGGD